MNSINSKRLPSFKNTSTRNIVANTITAAVFLLYVLVITNGPSLYAYMIVLAMEYDGNAVLKKEKTVKESLLYIIENADQYSIKAYTRTAISYKVKKTEATTHSFYVITHEGETYQTLSFSATGKWAVSKGAWTIDTDADISSYREYLDGINRWYVEEMAADGEIDTLRTMTNIIEKMGSGITYYYRAKVNKNDKLDNCNTALLETLAEKNTGLCHQEFGIPPALRTHQEF